MGHSGAEAGIIEHAAQRCAAVPHKRIRPRIRFLTILPSTDLVGLDPRTGLDLRPQRVALQLESLLCGVRQRHHLAYTDQQLV